MTGRQFEQRAERELPRLLAELIDASPDDVHVSRASRSADFVIDLPGGRRLVADAKTSSRSAEVAFAARQVEAAAEDLGGLPVVVVPHMGKAGERAVREAGVGYIDLSGNASLRDEGWYVRVEGRPNRFPVRGRPSSPFAPVSARVTRRLLLAPERWWRQVELAESTGLDDGQVSRIVGRLSELELVEVDERKVRPRDPGALLDAWAEDYDFRKHEIVSGHLTGAGIALARQLGESLSVAGGVQHAFTGLPAAWMLDGFAQFRLVSAYVDGDPHAIAEQIGLRVEPRGANVQLIGPRDVGVFDGAREAGGLNCAAPVQVYLDLLALPERAQEAAEHLRNDAMGWRRNA